MSGKKVASKLEALDTLRRRVGELERWFQTQDRQIRFLERERQKLAALVTHTDVGFLVLDPALRVVWMNTVCRDWFGNPPIAGAERATTCKELLCNSQETCAVCPAARTLAAGVVSHRETRLTVGGAPRQIYVTAMPIKSPDNRVDETMVMLQDITDLDVLRRSQDDLLRAKDLAESANRAKSEFLANMSHEVRTPMTGVLGMTGLLLDTRLSDEQREYARIIQGSAEALLGIINDILDFSKIEAGRLAIELIPFDLASAVDEVVSMLVEKAEDKHVELIVRYAPDVPRRVVGDAGRIRQVLLNLAGNAVKFTHSGHVLVDVEKLDQDDANVRLRVSVEDTGIGIEADNIDYIFEKFAQADGSITRCYGGTGLGLTISKHLVELMGGEIAVTSVPGLGSTFSFTLALPLDTGSPIGLLPPANLAGVRILVLHRNEKVRSVLAEQIASWSARSDGFATGEAAMAAMRDASARGDPYRIAVVAHDVPDMPVEAFATAIKEDPRLRDTALVMLTSLGQQGDAERLRSVGFDAYLTKPTQPSQLADVLSVVWSVKLNGVREVFVTRHTLSEARAQEAARLAPALKARVLVVDDDVVNQRVASRILEGLGCLADVAGSGGEAIEMLEARPYDVVFMDCQMREMDGFEATREVRRREALSGHYTPIVAMTAYVLPGHRERCLEAGMDDYLTKPLKKDALVEVLGRHALRRAALAGPAEDPR